jgi:hypothetical protein
MAVLNFRVVDSARQVWHHWGMVKRSSKRDFAQNALRVVEIATGALVTMQELATKRAAA